MPRPLSPCPFCGRDHPTITPDPPHRVVCECGLSIGWFDSDGDAIAAWEARANLLRLRTRHARKQKKERTSTYRGLPFKQSENAGGVHLIELREYQPTHIFHEGKMVARLMMARTTFGCQLYLDLLDDSISYCWNDEDAPKTIDLFY